jgi:hypothetical protein
MFCEDEVLETDAWAVILHEIGCSKEKTKKPRKKKRITKTRINQLLQIISFVTPASKSLEDLSYSALNLQHTVRLEFPSYFSPFQ